MPNGSETLLGTYTRLVTNEAKRSEESGSTEGLGIILHSFPLLPPSRTVVGENGNIVVEWQFNGKYFEIEETADGTIELMAEIDGVYRHWILPPNNEVRGAKPNG